MLTVNVSVLLAVVNVVRLRRRTEARSRNDEKMAVLIVLVFGALVAPTAFGQGVLDFVGQLTSGINDACRWPPLTRCSCFRAGRGTPEA